MHRSRLKKTFYVATIVVDAREWAWFDPKGAWLKFSRALRAQSLLPASVEQIFSYALDICLLLRFFCINVTVHKETMHNALEKIFELRPPLPITTFELLLQQI